MSYTQEELQNISKLLLSVDDANVDLAFVLMEQGGAAKALITELFAIYKLGSYPNRSKAKTLLLGCTDESPGLMHILNRKSHLDGASPRKKIKSFAADCADIDPMKLATALYNRYGEGLQYLVSELPEEDLKNLLMKHLNGTTFELTRKKITKIPPHIFKDYTVIETLDLSHNQIKTLPAGVGKLTNLKVLNLSHNKITKLNKAIGKLSQLEELYLNNNNIKELPAELSQLKNLKKLELEYINEIPFPAALAELPQLEELSLTYSSYSYVEIDEAFFNLKTDRLIRLKFGTSMGQTRWTNLPAFSEVTGTYDDPIDTHPLALARRAYAQKKECLSFLLEKAPTEEVHSLIQAHLTQPHTLTFEHIRLGRLPQLLTEYDLKILKGEGLRLIDQGIWTDLLYLPQLEVLDLGMSTDASSWEVPYCPIDVLQQLPQLKVLNLGTISPRYDQLPDFETLTQLEELWIYDYTPIASSDDFEALDKLLFLKKLPNLKKFCFRGISNDYYNQPEKANAVKQSIADYLQAWVPEGCEVLVGANDTSRF